MHIAYTSASPGYAPGITSIYCDAKSRPAPTQAQYVLFLFSVVSAQCHRMHLEHLEQHDSANKGNNPPATNIHRVQRTVSKAVQIFLLLLLIHFRFVFTGQ